MKKLCFSLVLFLTIFTLIAQDKNDQKSEKSNAHDIKTVFDGSNKISGFGAVDLEYAPMDGGLAVFTGGSGGITLGNIILGGYGIGLSTSNRVSYTGGRGQLHFGHGGFMLGFQVMPKRMIHLTANTKLGWGAVRIGDRNNDFDITQWLDNQSETVFVIQPSAGIELNMTKFFRIALTAQYRWVQGADDMDGFDAKKLNNPSVGLTLKFGWFN